MTQNVSQTIFCVKVNEEYFRVKSNAQNWATSVIFLKFYQRKQLPNVKLAQSGHLASNVFNETSTVH
jgi:hypothetical protein